MSRMITVAPVRKTVVVNATQQKAFDVFTGNMSRWWPATHTILKSPLKQTILEPRTGGRWYQIGEDGSECGTGHVLAWEPPSRVLLAWEINAEWKYQAGLGTEVEVRFVAEDRERTRVVLEHRKLDRYGDKAEMMRAMLDGEGAWMELLAALAKVAESSPA